MHEFAGEECEAGDLRLREGEELLVLSKRDDGWWKARRRKPMVGELDEGWVPSNYLRVQAGARSEGASKSTEVAAAADDEGREEGWGEEGEGSAAARRRSGAAKLRWTKSVRATRSHSSSEL